MKKAVAFAVLLILLSAAAALAEAPGLVIKTPEFASLMTPAELTWLKAQINRLYPQALDEVVKITGDESIRKSFRKFYISIIDVHPYETNVRGFSMAYRTAHRKKAQNISIVGEAILTGKMDLKTLLVHEMLHAALETRYSFDDYHQTPSELKEGIGYFATGEAHLRLVDDLNDVPEEFNDKAIWADALRRDYHRGRQFMRCFEKIYGREAFDKFAGVLFSGRGYKKALKESVGEDYKTVKKKCDKCVRQLLKDTLAKSGPIQQVIKAFNDKDYFWAIEMAKTILTDENQSDWRILAHWYIAQSNQKLYRFDEAIKHYEMLRMGKVGPNRFHESAAFQIIYCKLLSGDCETAAKKRAEFKRWYPEIWRDYMEDLDLGFAHECRKGTKLFNKAFFHFYNKEWEQSSLDLREALAWYLAEEKPNRADIAETLYTLGVVLSKQGNYENAISFYTQALDREKTDEGPDSNSVFLNVSKLAEAREALGHFQAAIEVWRDYMKYLDHSLRADDRYVARAKKQLGDLYLKLDRRAEAVDMLSQALATYGKILPDDDLWAAAARQSMAVAQMKTGEYEKALVNLDDALRVNRINYPEVSPKTAQTLMRLAECFAALGQNTDAKAAANEALRLLQSYPWVEGDDLDAAISLVSRLN